NDATITIAGIGFDPIAGNNSVAFDDGAGTVTAASTTSLTVTFNSNPTTAGDLHATVTTNSVSSAANVQVATVKPVVTGSVSPIAANGTTVVINGFGFDTDVLNTTVAFNNGAAGDVTAATANSLTVTFSTKPDTAGSLTAIVTTNSLDS